MAVNRTASTDVMSVGEDERGRVLQTLREVGLGIADGEQIEYADFGLGEFSSQGLSLLTYVNTDRYCAKELVLLPGQTCPEHRHPPVDGGPGKEETCRCRWGRVRLYVQGTPWAAPSAAPPSGSEAYYTVRHEV